jgi:hypothetical protein
MIDQTHRSVASFIYELPFGKGKRFGTNIAGVGDAILGGWQVSGIVTFSSGPPLSVGVSGDRANIGARRMQPAIRLGEGNDASLRGNIRNNPVVSPYFRTEDFAVTPIYTMGNAGRGILTSPGINNWDMSAFKRFHITEKVTLEFRSEFFNAWNHAQFGSPDTGVQSASFGRIFGARESRDIQLGLKVLF